jgi:hypothetical protein
MREWFNAGALFAFLFYLPWQSLAGRCTPEVIRSILEHPQTLESIRQLVTDWEKRLAVAQNVDDALEVYLNGLRAIEGNVKGMGPSALETFIDKSIAVRTADGDHLAGLDPKRERIGSRQEFLADLKLKGDGALNSWNNLATSVESSTSIGRAFWNDLPRLKSRIPELWWKTVELLIYRRYMMENGSREMKSNPRYKELMKFKAK